MISWIIYNNLSLLHRLASSGLKMTVYDHTPTSHLLVQDSVKVHQSHVQDLPLITTHLNTTVLTFHIWCWHIRMRKRGCCVSFFHSPATVHSTRNSVKICLSLTKVDCFCALWSKAPLQSFYVFCASKKCLISFRINLHDFCATLGYKQAFYAENVHLCVMIV